MPASENTQIWVDLIKFALSLILGLGATVGTIYRLGIKIINAIGANLKTQTDNLIEKQSDLDKEEIRKEFNREIEDLREKISDLKEKIKEDKKLIGDKMMVLEEKLQAAKEIMSESIAKIFGKEGFK